MLVLYSKNSINLDSVVNSIPVDVLSEEETIEETVEEVVYEQPEEEKENISEIMNRLVNMKIDIEKQSSLSGVKIDSKSFNKMLNLLLPESPKINPKYSYTNIKKYLSYLKELLKKDTLSLSQCLSILETFENYENENKDTINPAVKSMLQSVDEVKKVVVTRMYLQLIKKAKYFKERMEQLIKLYQNKMVFDELTLKATLDEMNANIDTIRNLYKEHYEGYTDLEILYKDILERKDTILELVSVENQKGI